MDGSVRMTSNGSLQFNVSSYQYGNASFNLTLRDDGGRSNGGWDTYATVLGIDVLFVNNPPHFDLADPVVVVNESTSTRQYTVDGVAVNISRGSPNHNEDGQKLTFSLVQTSGRSTLLVNSSVFLFLNGSFSFFVQGNVYGQISFDVVLLDSGGTSNGGSDISKIHALQLEVLPVPPMLISISEITLYESFERTIRFFDDVVFFKFRDKGNRWDYSTFATSALFKLGSPGMVECVSIICDNPNSSSTNPECSEQNWFHHSQCSNGLGSLVVAYGAHRWGNATMYLDLLDPTGNSFGSNYSKSIVVSVKPVNDPPSFSISTASLQVDECLISLPCEIYVSDFVSYLSLGQNEDGNCAPNFECEHQKGYFDIIVSGTNNMLEGNPVICIENRSLTFRLNENMFGNVNINVSLVDLGALDGTHRRSDWLVFMISVVHIRRNPTFNILHLVSVNEGSGLHVQTIASDIWIDQASDPITYPEYKLNHASFSVDVADQIIFSQFSNGSLYDNGFFPYINSNGTLVFRAAPDQFGRINCSVTLSDMYEKFTSSWFIIEINPVNHPPSFQSMTRYVAKESSGQVFKPEFAWDIKAGPPNEACDSSSSFCQQQTVTFIVDDVVYLNEICLFVVEPTINAEGTLMFTLTPSRAGQVILLFHLEDDGGGPNNSSRIQKCAIDVVPKENVPTFSWSKSCFQGLTDCPCVTTEVPNANLHCSATNDSASISIWPQTQFHAHVENLISIKTKNWRGEVSQLIRLSLTDTNSPTVLHLNAESSMGKLDPTVQREWDESSDRIVFDSNLYSISFKRNSLTTYLKNPKSPGDMMLIDRITDRLIRLAFTHLYSDYNWIDVCDLSTFKFNGDLFLIVASGCSNLDLKNTSSQGPQDEKIEIMSDFGLNITAGYWNFSAEHLGAPQKVNQFVGSQKVTCHSDKCTYSRAPNCDESESTEIGPASFRDVANILGSAVLVGPWCKTKVSPDWLSYSANNSLSALTFLMSNDGHQALQFDGVLNAGLYVTDDIGFLKDYRSVTELPQREISIEVWFTISATEVAYAGLVAAQQDGASCKKGWSLGYSQMDCQNIGCVTTFIFRISVGQNEIEDDGSFVTLITSRFTPSLKWIHLVATYNGTIVTLFLDGEVASRAVACSFPPCGDIHYPDVQSTDGGCRPHTPLTIGVYENPATGLRFPHYGAIKSVRILRSAISNAQARQLHQAISIPNISLSDYWVRKSAENKKITSYGSEQSLTLEGLFQGRYRYFCSFSHGTLSMSTPAIKNHSISSLNSTNENFYDNIHRSYVCREQWKKCYIMADGLS